MKISALRWCFVLCVALAMLPFPTDRAPKTSASSTAQTPATPVELHEGLVGQVGKLNPLFANLNPVDRDITSLIYEGLTSINAYGEVIPDLATGWVVSSDGRDYIFALRQDILWQDGIQFTAADVAYTFRTIRHPDFPGDPALRDFWRTVEIIVLDDFTIRFRLVQPLASFPERLRQGIVPVHALEGAPIATLAQHPFNLSPIGTGAYQIESLLAEDGQIRGISLRVAPNYRLRPEGAEGYAIDRVIFRTYDTFDDVLAAYRNGEINSLGIIPLDRLEDIAALNGVARHSAVAPGLSAIIFNWKRDDIAYVRDARLRQALAYATEHTSLLNSVSGRAVIATSPIPPTSWAYNPTATYPAQNLDEARRLIETVSFEPYQPEVEQSATDEEGEEDDEVPPPVDQRTDLTILAVDNPATAGVAFDLVNQWNQLDRFNLNLELVDEATFLERLDAGEFDIAQVEYDFSPNADPDQFTLWHSGQYERGLNYGGINDPFINNVLVQARQDPNGMHRIQHYTAFQETFAARVPAIPLYHPVLIYAPDVRLQGVQLDFISTPSDRFRTIQDWSFDF